MTEQGTPGGFGEVRSLSRETTVYRSRPMRMRLLASTLVALGGLSAADATPPRSAESAPGPRFGVGQQRSVVIRGMLGFDVLSQGQYLSGNGNASDHRGYGNIRAELGAKVRLDEQVAVVITLAYEAEAGDNTGNDPYAPSSTGFTVVDDAYAELNDVLGFETIGMKIGRQPVAWNLRPGHGSFLYDSAANHPKVTSWDGGRATWNVAEGIEVNPFAFSVPGASTLFGGELNWKPAKSGDSRTFLTAMATWEVNAPDLRVNPVGVGGPSGTESGEGRATFTPGRTGDRLATYYAGADFYLGNVELFAEGAMQNGNQYDGVEYAGYGMSGGLDWHLFPSQAFVVGLQVDHLSGDEDATDNVNRGFVNTWEGVSDTYIVESEQYGELSRYLQGNLQAAKLRAGVAFDSRNKVRLDAMFAYYRTAKPVSRTPGGPDARSFGQEGDLTLTWKYTYDATIRLFAAGFLPSGGFQNVAPNPDSGKDVIYLLGGNLTVLF